MDEKDQLIADLQAQIAILTAINTKQNAELHQLADELTRLKSNAD